MDHSSPQNETYPVGPPRVPKRPLTVYNAGANRGARENAPAYAEFNLSSAATALVPVYVDPAPGRANAMKEQAETLGIRAQAVEARVEDIVLWQGTEANAPILLNVDRPSTIANVLRQTAKNPRPILGYLLVKLPSGRLWAVRFVLEAHDESGRTAAIAYFEKLAELTERNTSAAIFGEAADAAHRLLEPAIRAWFAEHTKANLAKIAAGVEPATAPFEVTMDGKNTLPLLIAVRDSSSEPAALADELLKNPTSPIRRGTELMVAEVTPEGIRLHAVRRRTDDRVTVGGAEVIDRATIEARQMAQERLARAEREMLSRRNPVMTTD